VPLQERSAEEMRWRKRTVELHKARRLFTSSVCQSSARGFV
jgi:hypothetical protein